MYSPAFQTVIADARVEHLRRARGMSIQSRRAEDSNRRPAARWGMFSRAGIRRVVFADPSRAN